MKFAGNCWKVGNSIVVTVPSKLKAKIGDPVVAELFRKEVENEQK